MVEVPEPIVEGCIAIGFDRSLVDPRKVRTVIVIDYGMTDLTPEAAADKNLCVVRTIREQFGVALETFVD